MRMAAAIAYLLTAALTVAAAAQQTTESPRPVRADDEKAIRLVVEKFTGAYNAGDAKTVAALFDADGEIVDEDGERVRGQVGIERVFAEIFKRFPKSQIRMDVESIRFVGPAAAVEDGVSVVTRPDGQPAKRNRYTVVHVKRDNAWRMAVARDLPEEPVPAEEGIRQLGWLVGRWVDEGPDSMVIASYRWTEDRQAILNEFRIQVGGRPVATGTQRIGWDPATKKIHSWAFDSSGASAEGVWTRDGNRWIVKSTGVDGDGRPVSSTNILTRTAKHRATWQSRDRVVGDDVVPDVRGIVIVQTPPEPKRPSPSVRRSQGDTP